MRTIVTFLASGFLLVSTGLQGQITFLGFDQEQQGLRAHNYTWSNGSVNCSHGGGYKLFNNGVQVYSRCVSGTCLVSDVFYLDAQNVFMLEWSADKSNQILKSTDRGSSWISLGRGAPDYKGFRLLNKEGGYLVTSYGSSLLITRVSTQKWRNVYFTSPNRDTVLSDTLFAQPLWDLDTLSFRIVKSLDTISVKIALHKSYLDKPDIEFSQSVLIFPNPVNDFLTIETGQENLPKSVKVFSMTGEILLDFPVLTSKGFSTHSLFPGIYLIELTVGGTHMVRKFIKN